MGNSSTYKPKAYRHQNHIYLVVVLLKPFKHFHQYQLQFSAHTWVTHNTTAGRIAAGSFSIDSLSLMSSSVMVYTHIYCWRYISTSETKISVSSWYGPMVIFKDHTLNKADTTDTQSRKIYYGCHSKVMGNFTYKNLCSCITYFWIFETEFFIFKPNFHSYVFLAWIRKT